MNHTFRLTQIAVLGLATLFATSCGARPKIVRDIVPFTPMPEEQFQAKKDDIAKVANSTDASFGSTAMPYAKTYPKGTPHQIKRVAILQAQFFGDGRLMELSAVDTMAEVTYQLAAAALRAEGFAVVPSDKLFAAKSLADKGEKVAAGKGLSKQGWDMTGTRWLVPQITSWGTGGEWLSNVAREIPATDASGGESTGVDAFVMVHSIFQKGQWGASNGVNSVVNLAVPHARALVAGTQNGVDVRQFKMVEYNHNLQQDSKHRVTFEPEADLDQRIIDSEFICRLAESMHLAVRVMRDHCGYDRPANSDEKMKATVDEMVAKIGPPKPGAATAPAK